MLSMYMAVVFIVGLIVLTVVIHFMTKFFKNQLSWTESGITAFVAVVANMAIGMLLTSVVSPA